jgi:hypothetical protein
MKLKERGIVVQMLYWNNKQKGLQFLGSPMLNDVNPKDLFSKQMMAFLEEI